MMVRLNIVGDQAWEFAIAWLVGIWEYVRNVHPRVMLFIGLLIGGTAAYSRAPFGAMASALVSNPFFLIGSTLFAAAFFLLYSEIESPRHNPNVCDTND